MNTHTPGPWVVRPDYGKENVYRLWDQDTNFHDDTSPETMDANAKLIAAAPELLEACIKALAFIGYVNPSGEHTDPRDVLSAAIAKSAGQPTSNKT